MKKVEPKIPSFMLIGKLTYSKNWSSKKEKARISVTTRGRMAAIKEPCSTQIAMCEAVRVRPEVIRINVMASGMP
jgi:translation initiation factor IF-3